MHQSIYEINVRTWLRSQSSKPNNIAKIPPKFWSELKAKGIDYVWLMGVWETSQSSIDKYCFHPDLVRTYDQASKTWHREDIGGSPYAVEDYFVSKLCRSARRSDVRL